MPNRINQAFDDEIAEASDASERSALQDAKRVSEIVRRISSASDRQAVIAVLGEFDTLADLADGLAERRVIPFPNSVGS